MSKQVLSIEQMKHLKELGVDISRASVSWYRILRTGSDTVVTDRDGFEIYHEVPICENIIDAAYEMLCWCIDNGII